MGSVTLLSTIPPRADVLYSHLTDWMNEGGQSSTGQLLDFMIDTHPASGRLKELAKEKSTNHFSLLTEILQNMVKEKGVPFMSYLTKDIQLYPDLHGQSGWAVVECRPCINSRISVTQGTARLWRTTICEVL